MNKLILVQVARVTLDKVDTILKDSVSEYLEGTKTEEEMMTVGRMAKEIDEQLKKIVDKY